MHLTYEEKRERFWVSEGNAGHVAPHLHRAIEFVYVVSGELELGMGCELYHMEKGDFAIVFPNVIHHYQVFSTQIGRVLYLYADGEYGGVLSQMLQGKCPVNPVIKSEALHADIRYAIEGLRREKELDEMVAQAYIQMMLARAIPAYVLVEKDEIGNGDLIYRTMSYMMAHFKEQLSLTSVANALGVNRYSLSRVFSGTFHTNFNQYLNEIRLKHAVMLLEHTNCQVTEIGYEAGFESLRTFNRVFKQAYNMTPKEYRKLCIEKCICGCTEKERTSHLP